MTLLESLPMSIEAVLNALVISYLWFFGSFLFYHFALQARRSGMGTALSPNDLHHPHAWALFGAAVGGVPVLLAIFLEYFDHRRPLLVLRHILIWTLLYVPLGIAYFKLPW